MTDTSTTTRRNPHQTGRLRELPPFGEPDEPYSRPDGLATAASDDPRGVYMPPPEETTQRRR